MRSTSRQWRLLVLSMVVLVAGIAACGDDDDDLAATTTTTPVGEGASIPIVTVTTSEAAADDGSTAYSFDIAADLTAGPTQINLKNDGSAPHHVQIYKLNDGVTMDQFGETLATGDVGALLGIGAFVGGTGTADPGSESIADALVDLGEGNYVLLCFVEDENGMPHLAAGMVEPFTVGPAEGEVAEMPTPDATINMVDFGYDTGELPSSGVVELVNASDAQLHEMNLLALADGIGAEDVAAFFEGGVEGPPPFASIGGMQAVMPKGSSFLVLEGLDAGEYLMICHIPDPADGVPHADKGMAMPASVS